MLIEGSCHCGNITFRLSWDPDPTHIPARACDCTFCMKHGGLWTSHPAGALEVSVKDPSHVAPYEFGTRTATFHVCSGCGVVPVVTCKMDGRLYGVVSVRAFTNVDPGLVRTETLSVDGEALDSRLERRKRRWIGDVRFAGST